MDSLDTSEHYLTREETRLLLRVARDALELWLAEGRLPDLSAYDLTEAVKERHGAFVTLKRFGELRGCVGYTSNAEPLVKTVQENVVNAATRDMRFPPMKTAELPETTIEISALTAGDHPDTPFKRIADVEEIRIGRDGLYIEYAGMRGGLLLPQVAAERDWSVDQFLVAVCRKAGYADDAWTSPDAQLYRFSAQVFGEADTA